MSFSPRTVRRWVRPIDKESRLVDLVNSDDPAFRRAWKDMWETFNPTEPMPSHWSNPPIADWVLIRISRLTMALTHVLNWLVNIRGLPEANVKYAVRRAIDLVYLESMDLAHIRNHLRRLGISSTGSRAELLAKFAEVNLFRRKTVPLVVCRELDVILDKKLHKLHDAGFLASRRMKVIPLPPFKKGKMSALTLADINSKLMVLANTELVIEVSSTRVIGRWNAERQDVDPITRVDAEWCVERGLEFRIPHNLNADDAGIDASILADELGPEYFKTVESEDEDEEEEDEIV